jgi:hypothetical protein
MLRSRGTGAGIGNAPRFSGYYFLAVRTLAPTSTSCCAISFATISRPSGPTFRRKPFSNSGNIIRPPGPASPSTRAAPDHAIAHRTHQDRPIAAQSSRTHPELFPRSKLLSSGVVEGLNTRAEILWFSRYRALELARYRSLGKLPEPDSTHDFFRRKKRRANRARHASSFFQRRF